MMTSCHTPPPLEEEMEKSLTSSSQCSTYLSSSSSSVVSDFWEPDSPIWEQKVRKVQNWVQGYLARRLLQQKKQNSLARPVFIQISGILNFDVRFLDLHTQVYAIVTILRRPYGPRSYQFTTELSKNLKSPVWTSKFFLPFFSHKYDIVVSIIGMESKFTKNVFIGEAVLNLTNYKEEEDDHTQNVSAFRSSRMRNSKRSHNSSNNQENNTTFYAALGPRKKVPLDEMHALCGKKQYSTGKVRIHIYEEKPSSIFEEENNEHSIVSKKTSLNVMSGAVLVEETAVISNWRTSLKKKIGIYTLQNGFNYEKAMNMCSNTTNLIRKIGVLNETFISFYEQGVSTPHLVFDLRKIQLIDCNRKKRNEQENPADNEQHMEVMADKKKAYPLKLYHNGEVFVFYLPSKMDQDLWSFKINYNRRRLLVP